MSATIIQGNCLTELPKLKEGSVHCCVTSPPYFGLRDYKIPASEWPEVEFVPLAGLPKVSVPAMRCVHGLEPDPLSYVAHAVLIFREVRRVLRDDGTLWLNLGDSFANDTKWGGTTGGKHVAALHGEPIGRAKRNTGLKAKDLIGIPWRVAFALQADGWTLRSDVIWHKPNPMPESVTDRPTKAHEYIFLFSKQDRYFYDAEAIKEPPTGGAHPRREGKNSGMSVCNVIGKENSKPNPSRFSRIPGVTPKSAPAGNGVKANDSFHASVTDLVTSRNKRSVWTVATAPFKGAHFATFPPNLIRPCILASCPIGGTVLDPFLGSGTTAQVSLELGRHCIGIELSSEYGKLIEQRTNITLGLALT